MELFESQNKCFCIEIFDQQGNLNLIFESQNKCSCIEIFDQQGNLNLIFFGVILYQLVL